MAKAWTLKSSWYRYPTLRQTRGPGPSAHHMEQAYRTWINARDTLPEHLFRERFGY